MGSQGNKYERIAEQKKLRRAWRLRRFTFFFSLLFRISSILVIILVILLHRMFIGPSPTISRMLSMTLTETSALKFVPHLFMSEDTVNRIIDSSRLIEPEEKTDTSLIQIVKYNPSDNKSPEEASAEQSIPEPIKIETVIGATYKGYMMIVSDPSRVFLGVTNEYFNGGGKRIDDLAAKYDAVGGINASGFKDENGMGNGGSPIGMVISEGKLLRSTSSHTIAAFDENHILHVGKFTKEDVEKLGLRDGAGWGPALVVNGEPAETPVNTTGLNPRTAIGQRADGAVLMLVIDGRHPNSMGATYSDLIEVMVRYGAVNACNMDGGTSSTLLYEGERLSHTTTLNSCRSIPTAFLIRREATNSEP